MHTYYIHITNDSNRCAHKLRRHIRVNDNAVITVVVPDLCLKIIRDSPVFIVYLITEEKNYYVYRHLYRLSLIIKL